MCTHVLAFYWHIPKHWQHVRAVDSVINRARAHRKRAVQLKCAQLFAIYLGSVMSCHHTLWGYIKSIERDRAGF